MLGTPSLTLKDIVIGDRVQNFRCRQPEGSGSSEKLWLKSITVTTGPSSGVKTLPRLSQKCHPIRPLAMTSGMPPIKASHVPSPFLRLWGVDSSRDRRQLDAEHFALTIHAIEWLGGAAIAGEVGDAAIVSGRAAPSTR
jgi:hypothetical protein